MFYFLLCTSWRIYGRTEKGCRFLSKRKYKNDCFQVIPALNYKCWQLKLTVTPIFHIAVAQFEVSQVDYPLIINLIRLRMLAF